MDYLIERANEYGLQEIVGWFMKFENVQGIVLNIHPLWLLAWQWRNQNEAPNLEYILHRYWFPWDVSYETLWPQVFPDAAFAAAMPIDFSWRPPWWEELSGDPKTPPFVGIVALRPGTDTREFKPRDFLLPVVKEVRPVARFAGNPKSCVRPIVGGLSIGSGNSDVGTLGGIVEDQNCKRYGLTCQHIFSSSSVVDQPARVDGGFGTMVGTVLNSISPKPSPSGVPCNPYHPDAEVNELDLALIELDSSVNSNLEVLDIGVIDGLMPKSVLTPGLEVEVTGRTSGFRRLKIGGIAVTYKFADDSGAEYCFKNVFEVRWPRTINHLRGRPLSSGDSGAWVCAQGDSGTEWAGMVIGEDRLQGYAVLSENMLSTLQSSGFELRCA